MQTTPNYGYNMVESTDTCNVPVQISPNFSDIDTDLKAVSDAAITSAVDTFASNTHALVRNDADRNVLFFVAPADYTAGDVFTLDGVNMNVTDAAGNALESNAFRVNSVVLGIVYGTRLTLYVVNPVSVPPTPDAIDIDYDNTASGLTADNVQAAIDEIVDSVDAINEANTQLITGTLNAGVTTLTLASPRIKTTSIIDVWQDVGSGASVDIVAPTAIEVNNGSVVLTFEAQATNMIFGIRVY